MNELETENTFLKLQLKVQKKLSKSFQTQLQNRIIELEGRVVSLQLSGTSPPSSSSSSSSTTISAAEDDNKRNSGNSANHSEDYSIVLELLQKETEKRQELERYLDNLKWGFQQREDFLNRKIQLQKQTIMNFHNSQKTTIRTLRDVCDITCSDLDELETIL